MTEFYQSTHSSSPNLDILSLYGSFTIPTTGFFTNSFSSSFSLTPNLGIQFPCFKLSSPFLTFHHKHQTQILPATSTSIHYSHWPQSIPDLEPKHSAISGLLAKSLTIESLDMLAQSSTKDSHTSMHLSRVDLSRPRNLHIFHPILTTSKKATQCKSTKYSF